MSLVIEETQIETHLIKNIDSVVLFEEPTIKHRLVEQQVELGNYGRCDILVIDYYSGLDNSPYIIVSIVEIKTDNAGLKELSQLARYLCAIQDPLDYFSARFNKIKCYTKGYLVAPSFRFLSSEFKYIAEIMQKEISFIDYELCLEKGLMIGEYYYYETDSQSGQVFDSLLKNLREKIEKEKSDGSDSIHKT